MTWALWLLMIQGILGALDTLYYHEWRARLVAYSPMTSPELRLHAVMGLVYGAMLAYLLPVVVAWWAAPAALSVDPPAVPEPLRWLLWAMAVGVFLSGVRDVYATCGMPYGAWPWGRVALWPQETRT
jgi:hypothetical protein